MAVSETKDQGHSKVGNDVAELRQTGPERDRVYSILEQVFNTARGGMRIIDKDFNTIRVNTAFLEMTGLSRDEALAMKCYEAFAGSHCHSPSCALTRILAGEDRVEYGIEKQHPCGGMVPCLLTATPYKNPGGKLIGIIEDFRDLSDLKLAEQNLDLRARKLEVQQALLSEKEVALRQVLQQVEADKRRLERHILSNVNKIVIPLLRNARDKADDPLKQHLKLIEDSLKDITSPLVDEQDQRYASLTPREIEICNMIKQGLRSKEIARIFCTSEGTVEQQRKRIRRKLGLKGSTRNLTSFIRTK